MRLEASVEIPHERERVFRVYRDRLPDLVPFLPNVRAIEVLSRKESGERVELLNHWKGGGEIPSVVRPFVSEKLLEWDDYATWDRAAFTTEWRTVVPAFVDAVKATGQNRFEQLDRRRMRFIVEGNIDVDPTKIPGVPRLLGKAVKVAVETFLVAAIRPNTLAVSKGVERYLNEHPEA